MNIQMELPHGQNRALNRHLIFQESNVFVETNASTGRRYSLATTRGNPSRSRRASSAMLLASSADLARGAKEE